MNIDITWIPMTIENWHKNKICDTFWIVKYKNRCITGYFDIFDNLPDEEADHFLEYINCYYLNNKPCNRKNGTCICEEEEYNGNCVIDSISNDQKIENMLYLRMNLFKEIEKLKNERDFYKSKSIKKNYLNDETMWNVC